MVREYIGARYVPKFMDAYDPTQDYEALCVVDNGQGTSYISKIPTPAGTPLTDTNYWFIYGATSGAIIALQTQVNDILNRLDVTPFKFDSVSEMQSANLNLNDYALTSGYYNPNDGGGAAYIVKNAGTPDGGKIIALNNGLFAHQIVASKINVLTYGAKPNDSNFDNAPHIQSAINNAECGECIYIPNGLYYSRQIVINKQIAIEGDEATYQGIGTFLVSIAAESSIVVKSQDVVLKNIYVYHNGTSADPGYSSVAGVQIASDDNTSISGVRFYNVTSAGFATGFYISHVYVSEFHYCRAATCNKGFVLHGDTSTEFKKCWALDCSNDGFTFENVSYSKLSNCASDECQHAYSFISSHGVTLDTCGAERTTKTAVYAYDSDAVIIAFKAYQNNTSFDENASFLYTDSSFVSLVGCVDIDLYFSGGVTSTHSVKMVNNSIISSVGGHYLKPFNIDSSSYLIGNMYVNGTNLVKPHSIIKRTKTVTTSAQGVADPYYAVSSYDILNAYCDDASASCNCVIGVNQSGGGNRWIFTLTKLDGTPVANETVTLTTLEYVKD